MPPKTGKVGRPRKDDTEGTPKQIKQREYMRKYVAGINAGIKDLEKEEKDCFEHLDRVIADKKKLFDELDKANNQLLKLLKENTK